MAALEGCGQAVTLTPSVIGSRSGISGSNQAGKIRLVQERRLVGRVSDTKHLEIQFGMLRAR